MGRLVAALGLVVAVCLMPAAAGAAAAPDKPPSPAEMKEAHRRADKAAARLAMAQSALARAQNDVAELESHTASTRKVVDVLESQMRALAVAQYVQGNHAAATWVGNGDPGQAARGRAMLRFVSLGRTDSVQGYHVARVDLEQSQAALEERLGEQRTVVAGLRREEARVTDELDRLAAAQRAYEARIAAERAAAARAAKAAAKAPRASRNAGPVAVGPLPILGGGGGGWICPVQGPHAFSDDWGQPRSGGRHHEGNDILAPRNTPVVASVAGDVTGHNSDLGGISYYLDGEDGNTYFGTHLERLSGATGHVAAGTVVGYVGTSGNAPENVPHLHFEIHPGGGRPVNPFTTLSRYC